MQEFHGWLNIFKPKGFSSAKIVTMIKKFLPNYKIGHAGTLDLEAAGVLPIGIGEATKLMRFLVDAKKTYVFTIQFGAKTDTGDASGRIIETINNYPTKKACEDVVQNFLGSITQTPNIFSAIKVNGKRSYELARQGNAVTLKERIIQIYSLKLIDFNNQNNTATYITTCSKGTYIRSLAEDIALFLQTVGFVLELTRIRVGIFDVDQAINVLNLQNMSTLEVVQHLNSNKTRLDAILDDILVLEATTEQATKIKYGQVCYFDNIQNKNLVRIYYKNSLLAIGSLENNVFNSFRVFNLI